MAIIFGDRISINISSAKKQLKDMKSIATKWENTIKKDYPKVLDSLRSSWQGDFVEEYIQRLPANEIQGQQEALQELKNVIELLENEIAELEKIENSDD